MLIMTIILYIKQSSNTTFGMYLITIDIKATSFGQLLTNFRPLHTEDLSKLMLLLKFL